MAQKRSGREVFRVWAKYPAYKNIQYSNMLTGFANWGSFIAMLFLLNKITSNGLSFGTLWAVSGMAPLFFAPIVGVWVDRLEIRKSMIVGELIRSVLYFGFLLVPYLSGYAAWALFLVLRFGTGILSSFNYTARQAIIPELVAKEDLIVANSLSLTITNVLRLTGASVGGVLMAWFGMQPLWILAGVSFLLSAWLISRHKWESDKRMVVKKNFLDELKSGLQVSRANHWVRLVLVQSLFSGIMIGTFNLMLQKYATDIYQMAGYGLSLLYVVEGTVASVAGLWVADRRFQFKKISTYGFMYALFAISWILFGLSRHLWEGCLALVLFSVSGAFFGPFERQIMQTEIPAEMRGRIFGLWNTSSMTALQIGAFFTGVIISAIGLTFVPVLSGAFEMGFAVFFLVVVKRLERKQAATTTMEY